MRAEAKEELHFEKTFKYEHKGHTYDCKVEAIVGNASEEDFREGKRWIARSDLEVVIEENAEASLESLSKDSEFVELVIGVVNACIRSFRYSGNLQGFEEISLSYWEELVFQKLNVEVCKEADEWAPANEEPLRAFILKDLVERQYFDVGRTDTVNNSIDLGGSISPEREFMINSMHHLNSRNYRLAIIEAVVSIEIFLSFVIDEYLFFQSFMPEAKRKKFVESTLPLGVKLRGLLYFMLREEDLEAIDMEKVLTVVTWRNRIMHGPKNVDGDRTRWDLPDDLLELDTAARHERVDAHLREVYNLLVVLKKFDFDLGAPGSDMVPKKIVEL